MKKLLILFLALVAVFGFVACDNDTVTYADADLAASLVNSINKANVAEDILAAVEYDDDREPTDRITLSQRPI